MEKSEKVAALSILVNIILLAIKYTFAMLSGRVGLAADAIHSSRAEDKTVKSREIIYNPFLSMERGKGIMVAEFLIKRGSDVLLLKEKFEGKGPEYALANSDVNVDITEAETMYEALSEHEVILGREVNENNHIG